MRFDILYKIWLIAVKLFVFKSMVAQAQVNNNPNSKYDFKLTNENEDEVEPTPMAFQGKGQGLKYGTECNMYGREISNIQKSSIPLAEKQEKFKKACRLSQRLECIPIKTLVVVNQSGSHDEIPLKPPGICRCIRGISDRAIYIGANQNPKDKFSSGCYIPAGFSGTSICGHSVSLPYGSINDGTVLKTTIITRCVPNSECRTSSTYIGLRCSCKKETKWNSKDGTCLISEGVAEKNHFLNSISILLVLVNVINHYNLV